MKNVMGIIYTNKDDLSLRELTNQRSVAALPLAGRYRVVDFILSSIVNSGVRNVGVIMQRNYRSLMDHLGSGKEWDMSRKRGGLKLLPPFTGSGEYEGIIDALENVRGIFAYTAGEVVFETSRGRVRVAGEDLRIARYGEGDALVEGKVRLVELLEGEA